jgi:hypothetical protein
LPAPHFAVALACIAVCAAFVFAGCGGGDDDPPGNPPPSVETPKVGDLPAISGTVMTAEEVAALIGAGGNAPTVLADLFSDLKDMDDEVFSEVLENKLWEGVAEDATSASKDDLSGSTLNFTYSGSASLSQSATGCYADSFKTIAKGDAVSVSGNYDISAKVTANPYNGTDYTVAKDSTFAVDNRYSESASILSCTDDDNYSEKCSYSQSVAYAFGLTITEKSGEGKSVRLIITLSYSSSLSRTLTVIDGVRSEPDPSFSGSLTIKAYGNDGNQIGATNTITGDTLKPFL